MKKLVILCYVFLQSIGIHAQYIKDTVVIFIDNELEFLIAIDDYDHLRENDQVSSILTQFQTYMSDITNQLNPDFAELITYYPDSSISVQPREQKNIFLIEGEKLKNTGKRDKAVIKLENISITLTSNDLSTIENKPLTSCYEKMLLLLPEKSRMSRKLYYQCQDEELSIIEDKSKINYATGGDILEINAGVSASVVKNQLVGDFSFTLGLGFNKKGVLRSKPYASINLMYDFSEGNKMNINTFLNIGHNWGLSKKIDEAALIGLELGYLISRNGDLFEENTFRFGINYVLPSGFDISPQVYMGDEFKRFYPGIRMGFTF